MKTTSSHRGAHLVGALAFGLMLSALCQHFWFEWYQNANIGVYYVTVAACVGLVYLGLNHGGRARQVRLSRRIQER